MYRGFLGTDVLISLPKENLHAPLCRGKVILAHALLVGMWLMESSRDTEGRCMQEITLRCYALDRYTCSCVYSSAIHKSKVNESTPP